MLWGSIFFKKITDNRDFLVPFFFLILTIRQAEFKSMKISDQQIVFINTHFNEGVPENEVDESKFRELNLYFPKLSP